MSQRFRLSMLALLMLAAGRCAYAQAGPDPLLSRLWADYRAQQDAQLDYRQRSQSGLLGPRDAADYRAYLAHLAGRVAEDCMALAIADERVRPPDPPCSGAMPQARGPATQARRPAATRAEQAAVLEAALQDSLSEFDEILLREQQRVKAATPRGAGTSGSAGSGSQGAGGREGASAEAGGAAGREASAGTDRDGKVAGSAGEGGERRPGTGARDTRAGYPGAGGGPGTGRRRGTPPPPAGMPNGSDDDLVARQLREAAEKETDPELKEKLWEEYRRYKAGTR